MLIASWLLVIMGTLVVILENAPPWSLGLSLIMLGCVYAASDHKP